MLRPITKAFLRAVFFAACAFILIFFSSAESAEKAKEKTPPATVYWMSVSTQNQTIPGMSEDMSGMDGFAGRMMGGRGFGPHRDLLLQLNSPQSLPKEPSASHDIPPGQKMGEALPLVIPLREKARKEEYEKAPEERVEKPKARMLIYWGCSETVGKGQPRVIDTEKMGPAEFGKALTGHMPSPQYPPSPRSGMIYAEWPNKESSIEVPKDSSLQGSQFVHGNYLPDIKFSIDQMHDFMAPVKFTSVKGELTESIRFSWKDIPTAIGYFATAMGHNEKTGETIIWSSSELPDPGFGLMNYLPSTDVRKFIKEKVVMNPDTTSCSIPKGIFRDAGGGMIQFIAYGEDMYASYPPKPKDPKAPWNLIWSVKLRLKSTGMTPLTGTEAEAAEPRRSREKENDEPSSETRKADERKEDSGGGTLRNFRKVFGF